MNIVDLIKENFDDAEKLQGILMPGPQESINLTFEDPSECRDEFNNRRNRRVESVEYKPGFQIAVYSETETELVNGELQYKILRMEEKPSAKLIFPFPQKITETQVAFLYGGEMNIESDTPSEKFDDFKKYIQKTLRLQSVLKKFARTVLSETRSAIQFFIRNKTETSPAKLCAIVLDVNSGDFKPLFDEFGDMIAFSRRYETTKDFQKVEVFVVFTDKFIFEWINKDGTWIASPVKINFFQKIPFVYETRQKPCWEDIVSLLDKYENRASRLSDTNDYFSEPIAIVHGKPINLPEKGRPGKMIRFKDGTDLNGKPTSGTIEYLTWDHSPTAIELELKMLKEGIYDMTFTPDLSFSSMQGIGNVANYAVKLMFISAEIKRQQNEESFNVSVERCINVIKAGYKAINLGNFDEDSISVNFGSILPEDLKEEIDNISNSIDAKILSKETGVMLNKLVPSASKELTKLKKEADEERNFSIETIMGGPQDGIANE